MSCRDIFACRLRRRPCFFAPVLALVLVLVLGPAACQPTGSPAGDGPWTAEPSATSSADGQPMPAGHTAQWLANHGVEASSQGADCAACHSESDCVDCHVESLDSAYTVHPPNYAIVHATDASQGLMDCTTCHRLDTFCQACHAETQVLPDPDHSPPPGRDSFHPPGWVDGSSLENHGVMARQNINDCASCHVEQDCISCHVGINPHPPEFQMDCRRLLETSGQACAQCHQEGADQLRGLCL